MRRIFGMSLITGLLLFAASLATAQRPGGQGTPPADDLVTRLMAFDADKSGTLTRSEVTDERLVRLFDRADANKDGVVTKDELTALAAREKGAGRGGPGGPMMGMGMGMPRPGDVLPPMARQRLRVTPEQTTQLDALQAEVDSRLKTILTAEQTSQLKTMRERGPGGPGGFGPPPGGGPPGGGPPGQGVPPPPPPPPDPL